ncbi:AraC family transcriptional regulator [Paenibacillus qinlingensis]|uniref:AraC-like DNA-binding protein n=1 Tax=Paenibacillus qinlingensis TaxID=1837343 RepID=A0ABU1NW48_9BACL|nr:AraC family transcriptional regulator [Paenibacillus qinlingensis]MDR6551681.1 AraC-like DNA-binding protein [Paenibacillus qinlingensis]
MKITQVMYYEAGPSWHHDQFVQDYDLLMLITDGKLRYVINGVEISLEKGDVLYLPHGTVRIGLPVKGESHCKYGIRFIPDAGDEEFSMLQAGKPVKLASKRLPFLEERVGALMQHWRTKDIYYLSMCRGILLEVLSHVSRELHRGVNGRDPHFVYLVRDYMYEHYRSPLTVKELAEHAGKTPSYLITCFTQAFGCPPLQFMHKLRLAKAEELLLSTDRSIEEISLELGYCDSTYFYRVFRKHHGTGPLAFRLQV